MNHQSRFHAKGSLARDPDRHADPPALPEAARLRHHPRAKDASLEKLDQIAGIISLTGPAPSSRFLESDDERCDCDDGDGD